MFSPRQSIHNMLVPVIGGFVNVPQNNGGGGVPQLPSWTFQAADSSDPTPGKFTTNAATKGDTTLVYLSLTPKNGGDASFIQAIGVFGLLASGIVLTDSVGLICTSQVSNVTLTDFGLQLAAGFAPDGSWGGDYSLSFFPIMTQMLINRILTNSGITPCPDGTVSPVTSITTQNGIITAIS